MSNPPTYKWYAEFNADALKRERELDCKLADGFPIAEYVAARNMINAERAEMNNRLTAELARPTHDITLTGHRLITRNDYRSSNMHWTISDTDFGILNTLIDAELVRPKCDNREILSQESFYNSERGVIWPQCGIIVQMATLGLQFELLEYDKSGNGLIRIRLYLK